MSKKKRRKVLFVTLSPLRSPASTVWAIGFLMMRGMHKAMVTDILRAVKVEVASIGTVLTMKEL
jgi:hypothetical protein